jgi:hypothetical protein
VFVPGCGVLIEVVGSALCVSLEDRRVCSFLQVVAGCSLCLLDVGGDAASWLVYTWV